MSDQPPYDRPDQGGPPQQSQGGRDDLPPGGGWPRPDQGSPDQGPPPGYGGQPGYDQPGYDQRYGTAPKNGMGTAALVVGIIGVVLAVLFAPLGILLGILAAVFGFLGRKKAARREATNRGQATAGLVLGLVAVLVGGIIVAFVGTFIAENSDEIEDLAECLDDADTAAEQTECREEFEGELES